MIVLAVVLLAVVVLGVGQVAWLGHRRAHSNGHHKAHQDQERGFVHFDGVFTVQEGPLTLSPRFSE